MRLKGWGGTAPLCIAVCVIVRKHACIPVLSLSCPRFCLPVLLTCARDKRLQAQILCPPPCAYFSASYVTHVGHICTGTAVKGSTCGDLILELLVEE